MTAHRLPFDGYRAPWLMTDPGASGTITVDRWGAMVPIVSATTETRTLAVPTKAGLLCTVLLDDDGGDVTLTVTSGYNQTGDTTITLDTAGDFVTFISVKIGSNYRWRIAAQEGTGATVTDVTAETITADTLTATALKLAVNAVAAAGSLQGEGGNLVAGLNVVSAADNTKCVDLPSASAGTVVAVVSATAAKTLPVFPATNESIDNASDNAAVTLGAATAYTTGIFIADNASHWVSILGDTA